MSSSLTFPAALLGTTVRLLRTAAGRRALQLVLLVGGLFTLGFVCGEQAHAADGNPLPALVTSTAGRPGPGGYTDPARAAQAVRAADPQPAFHGAGPQQAFHGAGEEQTVQGTGAAQAVQTVHGAGAAQVVHAVPAVPSVRAVRTVGGRLAGPVVRGVDGRAAIPVQVVGSVGDSVRDVLTVVSRPVLETAGRAVSGRSPSTAPPLPLPDLAPVTDVPVQMVPEPASVPPGKQWDAGAVAAAPTEERERHAGAVGRAVVGAPVPAVVYGPDAEVRRSVAYAGAWHAAAVAVTAAGVPERPVPTGDPDGVLGKQAADGSASRHGDAHAVALGDRASVRLAPGATAGVDAPRTRERHRDIPVFPG
ncbi:hypothetical protein [Streptomyces sp. NPDC048192]|uniref:hypothetical protein n=1 Tax=Streptomyces sp. NPDC048192 TaxID=3365510 RepID=UPI00371E52CE